MADLFIERLARMGWKCVASPNSVLRIPSRYASVSDELMDFLGSFDVLCSKDETQWFFSTADYHRRTEGFNWDTFERISLEAAEGDSEWRQTITSFWASHLPVFMNVRSQYAYAAYCCAGRNAGSYVSGSEPEFEEVSVIGRTLAELQNWVLDGTDA